ncbi:MAG: 4Fe-4S dicluster domain-containing protein [bacterium]
MRERISIKEVQSEFVKKIEELSGQNLMSCYQCGKCSAGCPVVEAMDILPNQIIRLVQMGQKAETLNAKTIWLCAACFTCRARCPRGVDLPAVMEALRQVVLRKDGNFVEPSKMSGEDLKDLPQIAVISNFRKFTE